MKKKNIAVDQNVKLAKEGDELLIKDAKFLQGSAMAELLRKARAALVGRIIVKVGYVQAVSDSKYDGIVDPLEVYPLLVLDNGVRVYVQRDDESNGPGVLFLVDKTGNDAGVMCQTRAVKPLRVGDPIV